MEFLKAVEIFCGVRAGSLLVARSDQMATFTKGGLGQITLDGPKGAAATTEQFECVMKVMSAADLRSRRIFFGFIGNDTVKAR